MTLISDIAAARPCARGDASGLCMGLGVGTGSAPYAWGCSWDHL